MRITHLPFCFPLASFRPSTNTLIASVAALLPNASVLRAIEPPPRVQGRWSPLQTKCCNL
jgi:hypothetical protein